MKDMKKAMQEQQMSLDRQLEEERKLREKMEAERRQELELMQVGWWGGW